MNHDTPSAYVDTALRELDDKRGIEYLLAVHLPARLFHYTDAAGLKGILQSGELHATDLRFMNDSGELQYARKLIQEVLNNELAQFDSNLAEIFRQGIGVLNLMEEYGFYAACFCEESDVLSQWRAYGNAGGGYAVGFDVPALASNLISDRTTRQLQRVDYDPTSQRERVRRILKVALSICQKCYRDFAGRPDLASAVGTCVGHTVRSLFWEQSRMKHPLFREEKEWRIIEIEERTSFFRIFRAGLLVPFIELSHHGSEGQRHSVAELHWGPTLTPDLAKLSLEALAHSFGYQGLSIQGSTIPPGA